MNSRSFMVATSLPLTAAARAGASVRPCVALLRRGLFALGAGVLAGCASVTAPRPYPPQATTSGYYPAQPVPPTYSQQSIPPDYPSQADAGGYYPAQPGPPAYPPPADARGYYPPQSIPPDYPRQADPRGYYSPQSVPPDYPRQPGAPTYSLPPPGPIGR